MINIQTRMITVKNSVSRKGKRFGNERGGVWTSIIFLCGSFYF